MNRDGRVDFNDGVLIGQGNNRRHNPLDLNGDGRVDYRDGIIYGQSHQHQHQHQHHHH